MFTGYQGEPPKRPQNYQKVTKKLSTPAKMDLQNHAGFVGICPRGMHFSMFRLRTGDSISTGAIAPF
jgi:hypothetical protein